MSYQPKKEKLVIKVGFIGAGNVARTFGRHLIIASYPIPEVQRHWLILSLISVQVPSRGPTAQAAECDVVILATKWLNVPEALRGIDWRGRILIDATNAHMDPVPDISLAGVTRSRAALNGHTSSEMIAEMAADARLVKSISNMPMAPGYKTSPRTNLIPSSSHPATTSKQNSW